MDEARDGIRVIDMTHDRACPSCAGMPAWPGAELAELRRYRVVE